MVKINLLPERPYNPDPWVPPNSTQEVVLLIEVILLVVGAFLIVWLS